MSAVTRIINYARALASAGIDCKILIAKSTEVYGRESANTATDGCCFGVPFHYVSGTPLRSRSLLRRKVRDLADVFATRRTLRTELSAGDAVIGYLDGHPFLVSVLLRCCRSRGIRYVSELCEYPYEAGTSLPLSDRLARRFVLRRLFPRFDGVIAISEYLATFARKYCSPSCKVVKVPILVDFDAYSLRDLSAREAVPYIFHCGTLYDKKDGFSGMLEAFGRAVKERGVNARFVSTGSVEEAQNPQRLLAIIKKYAIEERVSFVGYVSREEIGRLLSGASLVVINKPDNLQNRSNFSTKLGEYLAAGKTVIHTRVGEALNYLRDHENALLVPCGDVSALAASIVFCLNHPDEAREMGEAGRELCRGVFDFGRYGETLLEVCR